MWLKSHVPNARIGLHNNAFDENAFNTRLGDEWSRVGMEPSVEPRRAAEAKPGSGAFA